MECVSLQNGPVQWSCWERLNATVLRSLNYVFRGLSVGADNLEKYCEVNYGLKRSLIRCIDLWSRLAVLCLWATVSSPA